MNLPSSLELPEVRRRLLVREAVRWVGVREKGGNNLGQLVEMFLKSCALAPGNPWCLAFALFCVQGVDAQVDALFLQSLPGTALVSTGHCLTLWQTAPLHRRQSPEPGFLVLWQKEGTTQGHAGIVIADLGGGRFQTVEGNTADSEGIAREGDGVFLKERRLEGHGQMRLLGFLNPWT